MPHFIRFHHDLDHDRTYIVAATRLKVRSPRTALAFFRRLGPITKEMEKAEGLTGFGLKAQLHRMTFSTYGVFESRRALAGFLGGGAHGEAMVALKGRLHHVEARTLSLQGGDVPRSWRHIPHLLEEAEQPATPDDTGGLPWPTDHSA